MELLSLTAVFGLGFALGAGMISTTLVRIRRETEEYRTALDSAADKVVNLQQQLTRPLSVSIYNDPEGLSDDPLTATVDAEPILPMLVVAPLCENRAAVFVRTPRGEGEVHSSLDQPHHWVSLTPGLHREVLFSADGLYVGTRGHVHQPWEPLSGGRTHGDVVRELNAAAAQPTPHITPAPIHRSATQPRRLDFEL